MDGCPSGEQGQSVQTLATGASCVSGHAYIVSGLVRWTQHLGRKDFEVTPGCPWLWPIDGDHQRLSSSAGFFSNGAAVAK